jgi:uracil-DNA glycosylase
VCLGATAAQTLIAPNFRVMRQRGQIIKSKLASLVTATVHPSSILRAPDSEARRIAMKEFVADLKNIARPAACFRAAAKEVKRRCKG